MWLEFPSICQRLLQFFFSRMDLFLNSRCTDLSSHSTFPLEYLTSISNLMYHKTSSYFFLLHLPLSLQFHPSPINDNSICQLLGFIFGFPFSYIFFIILAANTVSFAFKIYLESDYFLSSLQLPPYSAAQFPRLP